MTLHSVDLRTTGQFPALLLDYLDQKPTLESFYGIFPTLENAEKAILNKKGFTVDKRKTHVDVLTKQYHGLPYLPDFSVLLQENTFTVNNRPPAEYFHRPVVHYL